MKIMLTTLAPDIQSEVDPRFGRGAYFLIIDPNSMEWQAMPNPALSAPGGAGIQAAQFVNQQPCEAVISGDFGPNAFDALKAGGISMYLYGDCHTVHEAIRLYQSGQLESLTRPPGKGRRHR